jgi:uncharacterized protein involved in propanediol utilization
MEVVGSAITLILGSNAGVFIEPLCLLGVIFARSGFLIGRLLDRHGACGHKDAGAVLFGRKSHEDHRVCCHSYG